MLSHRFVLSFDFHHFSVLVWTLSWFGRQELLSVARTPLAYKKFATIRVYKLLTLR